MVARQPEIVQFQFLIGRLGTKIWQGINPAGNSFQFLIGRLGTFSRVFNLKTSSRFNSS